MSTFCKPSKYIQPLMVCIESHHIRWKCRTNRHRQYDIRTATAKSRQRKKLINRMMYDKQVSFHLGPERTNCNGFFLPHRNDRFRGEYPVLIWLITIFVNSSSFVTPTDKQRRRRRVQMTKEKVGFDINKSQYLMVPIILEICNVENNFFS